MSILHNQLALYGEIDEIVVEALEGHSDTDAAVLIVVEQLLPQTTGFGQAGWYRELQRFLNQPEVRSENVTRVTFPTAQLAVDELSDLDALRAKRTVDKPLLTAPGMGFEDEKPYNPQGDPVLARAGYAAFVLAKIESITGGARVTDVTGVLRTGIGAFTGLEFTENDTVANDLMQRVGDIDSRESWLSVADDVIAANAGLAAGRQFTENSLPCFGSLELVDGQYCSTVATNSTADDVSVAQIEAIIDPINWNRCSKFFCTMWQNQPYRTATRWSRVREKVGAECSEYGLITDLVFYKVKDKASGSIYLNYDIDPARKDPGYVEVDNGYIWVSPLYGIDPTKPGVRIRTSKRERVNGLSPCATAALACLMGWADAGREMLAGTARDIMNGKNLLPPPLKVFYPSVEDDPSERD